jgi:hypothetical protein
MIGNDQICYLCNSEIATKGCLCNGVVQLIGNSCLVDHLEHADVDHNLLDLDLALRMLSDPSLIEFYLKELSKMHRASKFLRRNSDKIKSYKIFLRDSKKKLIDYIDETFASIDKTIEEADKEISTKLKWLNKYKTSLCEEGRLLMEKYKAQRSKGLLQNNIKKLDIPIDEIIQFITDRLNICNSRSTPKDQIYENYQEFDQKLKKLAIDCPYYSKQATKIAERKCGPFKYDADFSDKCERIFKGPIELENGAFYIGEWNQYNQKHGAGMNIWQNGSKYEGYWKQDKANGKGRMTYAGAICITGGAIYNIGGDIYEGDWVDDKKHGTGVFLFKDGARYEGDWREDKQHGNGKFYWADGSTYDGEYQNNTIHGKGIYVWSDGRKFEGEWQNNKMNGKGVFEWPDGRSYIGEYQDDKKQGYGVFKWPDGRKYEGYWQNSKQHGKGVIISAKGDSIKGEWRDGKRID